MAPSVYPVLLLKSDLGQILSVLRSCLLEIEIVIFSFCFFTFFCPSPESHVHFLPSRMVSCQFTQRLPTVTTVLMTTTMTKARMVTSGEQLEDVTTPTTPKLSLRSWFRQWFEYWWWQRASNSSNDIWWVAAWVERFGQWMRRLFSAGIAQTVTTRHQEMNEHEDSA